MSKVFTDEEGKEITAFTQEEVDAQIVARETALKTEHDAAIAEKEAHQAEKLAQMEKVQAGAAKAEKNAQTLAEETKKYAEEAKATVEASKAEALQTKKAFWIQSVVGGDAELTKKILENYELLGGMPVTNDAEIQARVQKAVNASGIGNVASYNSGISLGGASAANVMPSAQSEKEHNYEVWKNELGITDLVPKKPNQ